MKKRDARKLSTEAQFEIRTCPVRMVCGEGFGKLEAAEALGVTRQNVGRWVKLYEEGGMAALELGTMVSGKVRQNHDLFGRPATVVDSRGSVTYGYDDPSGQLASETYSANHALLPGISRSINYGQNPNAGSFLQPQAKSISQGSSILAEDWSQHDDVGRRKMFYHTVPPGPQSTVYRDQALFLLEFYEGTRIPRRTQTYDWVTSASFLETTNLDASYRLNSKRTNDYASFSEGAILTSVGYAHDRAGRRTHATREDGTTWRYDYNERGEVSNAAKLMPAETPLAGQQFAYRYDDIGNRTSARYVGGTGTNAGPQRETSYDANALNQYIAISHPQTMDILGFSDENSGPVLVAGQLGATDQQGDRFRAEIGAIVSGKF